MTTMSGLKYRLAAAPVRLLDGMGLVPRPQVPVAFVAEAANWSTFWDGTYICREIEKLAPGTAELIYRPHALARRIVHFGSQFQWLAWADALARSNRFVATFFHGKPSDGDDMARHVDDFLASVPRLTRVVTAAELIEARLLDWGVPREKLIRIPIGVDTDLFRPANAAERKVARTRYAIPDEALVIGSFQKDGVGWGEGDEPKLIKGPDVFLDVVDRVARKRPVFVLLTGPARGFVKRGLDRLRIPYAHDYVEDYLTLPQRYAALDIYLNPSREEGGPKGILEGMATGVTVVSTRVGMAPEMVRSGETGWLEEVDDVERLAAAVLEAGEPGAQRERIVKNARAAIAACDWREVGRRHYEDLYRPLIEAGPR
jgi:glycosyltransferase involved in cell wall biosynthesis